MGDVCELNQPRLVRLLERLPFVQTRTVVRGDFIDQGQWRATMRVGNRDALHTAVLWSLVCLDPPSEEGTVKYTAERIATLPLIGDVLIRKESLGENPEGYERVLMLLGGQSSDDEVMEFTYRPTNR